MSKEDDDRNRRELGISLAALFLTSGKKEEKHDWQQVEDGDGNVHWVPMDMVPLDKYSEEIKRNREVRELGQGLWFAAKFVFWTMALFFLWIWLS